MIKGRKKPGDELQHIWEQAFSGHGSGYEEGVCVRHFILIYYLYAPMAPSSCRTLPGHFLEGERVREVGAAWKTCWRMPADWAGMQAQVESAADGHRLFRSCFPPLAIRPRMWKCGVQSKIAHVASSLRNGGQRDEVNPSRRVESQVPVDGSQNGGVYPVGPVRPRRRRRQCPRRRCQPPLG